MKKMKTVLGISLALGLVFTSCENHEIIPAPTPNVKLFCEFEGVINNTPVKFTQNVDGYRLDNTQAKTLLPPPSMSSAFYFAEILSSSKPASIKVGLGRLTWDASTLSTPTLEMFKNYHLNTLTPAFSNLLMDGFEVTYQDGLGKKWVSNSISTNFQNVTFSMIKQESDSKGDYSKFVCDFTCYVYHLDTVTLVLDSLPIQSAKFKGWFKR
jgi:hypothetical protein